ncbi:hypothetical protein Q3H58_004474 [Pseudomonas psychrotolerans]|nr:hypothetical protein [Pseudomonas psychrotolerans]
MGDFAWYDQVLTHSLMVGAIPERFRGDAGAPTLQTLFAMARGVSDSCCAGAHAQEMTKWFDTNYHYLVPEFTEDQAFALSWEQLFEEVAEARALGHAVKPVVLGPLTYLWLGKTKGTPFDKLALLERLLPLYTEIFQRLAAQGVEWVQIDEPILVLDLPRAWKNAFERDLPAAATSAAEEAGGYLFRGAGGQPGPGRRPAGGRAARRSGPGPGAITRPA